MLQFIQTLSAQVVLYTVLVGVLTFFWRYLFSHTGFEDLGPMDDTVVHLYFVKRHSISPFRFKTSDDDRFTIKSRIFYPQLFHRLAAVVLGFSGFLKKGKYVTPFIDSLFNVFLFLFSFFLFRQTGFPGEAHYGASVVSVLYLFSPLFFFFRGRVANVGPRVFGYTLGMISFLITLLFLQTMNWMLFSLVVCLNIMIFFSSQFTLQAVLFLNVLTSITALDMKPLLSVLAGLAAVFVIDMKGSAAFLQNKWRHLVWYYRGLREKKITLLKGIYRGYWQKILLFTSVYLLLFLFIPDILKLWGNSVFHWMLIYIASSWIIFGLIFLPPLKPLGEAHRYLEYSHPFALLILTYVCFQNSSWIPLLLLFCLNLLSTIHYVLKFNQVSGDRRQMEELVKFLKHHPEKVLLPIPLKMSFFLAIYLENKLVASVSPLSDEKIIKRYDYPIDDFLAIDAVYPFDWIVYKKGADRTYDFSDREIVYRNSKYIVFKK